MMRDDRVEYRRWAPLTVAVLASSVNWREHQTAGTRGACSHVGDNLREHSRISGYIKAGVVRFDCAISEEQEIRATSFEVGFEQVLVVEQKVLCS